MKIISVLLLVIACFGSSAKADPLAYEDSRFGILAAYAADEFAYFESQMGFTDPAYWNWANGHFSNLGAHWTRSNLQLVWDYIEPVLNGPYQWNAQPFQSDSVITNIYKPGNQVNWLGVFHSGGLFGAATNKPALRDPLSDPGRYVQFVQAAVNRYSGNGSNSISPGVRVKYWQLGNEVPKIGTAEQRTNYVNWFKLTASAIRTVDPSAKIALIAPVQGFAIDTWLQDVIIDLGDTNWFDVVDIHHWGRAIDYKMIGVGQTRQFLDSRGLTNVQIWSSENGTWTYQPSNQVFQTQDDQARSLIKRYVYNTDLGLDKLFWNNLVEWHDFSGDPGSVFNSMGLIGDGSGNSEPPANLNVPRVSYYAYKLLAAAIDTDQARYTGKLSLLQATNVFAYSFDSPSVSNAARHILWRDVGTANVAFGIGSRRAMVTDLITDSAGNILQQYTANADTNGNITVNVGIDPLLVQEISDAPPRFAAVDMVNGRFSGQLDAAPGQTCILSGSTNLNAWAGIQTNTLNKAIWNFVDPDATNFTRRFYRATLVL